MKSIINERKEVSKKLVATFGDENENSPYAYQEFILAQRR